MCIYKIYKYVGSTWLAARECNDIVLVYTTTNTYACMQVSQKVSKAVHHHHIAILSFTTSAESKLGFSLCSHILSLINKVIDTLFENERIFNRSESYSIKV